MTIYFATDHAGLDFKDELLAFARDELGYDVEDCGAHAFDADDDYPDFIHQAAAAVAANPEESRGVVIGGSGQGEAMCANRYPGVRAALYYGEPAGKQVDATGQELDMITSTRDHNDANVLSFGARFVTIEEAKTVLQQWLETPFSEAERHQRRINKIDGS